MCVFVSGFELCNCVKIGCVRLCQDLRCVIISGFKLCSIRIGWIDDLSGLKPIVDLSGLKLIDDLSGLKLIDNLLGLQLINALSGIELCVVKLSHPNPNEFIMP